MNRLEARFAAQQRRFEALPDVLKPTPTHNEDTKMPRSPIMQFFAYAHLPEHLQVISRPFGELAEHQATLPSNAEKSTALRKLLESKDSAVRAVLPESARD